MTSILLLAVHRLASILPLILHTIRISELLLSLLLVEAKLSRRRVLVERLRLLWLLCGKRLPVLLVKLLHCLDGLSVLVELLLLLLLHRLLRLLTVHELVVHKLVPSLLHLPRVEEVAAPLEVLDVALLPLGTLAGLAAPAALVDAEPAVEVVDRPGHGGGVVVEGPRLLGLGLSLTPVVRGCRLSVEVRRLLSRRTALRTAVVPSDPRVPLVLVPLLGRHQVELALLLRQLQIRDLISVARRRAAVAYQLRELAEARLRRFLLLFILLVPLLAEFRRDGRPSRLGRLAGLVGVRAAAARLVRRPSLSPRVRYETLGELRALRDVGMRLPPTASSGGVPAYTAAAAPPPELLPRRAEDVVAALFLEPVQRGLHVVRGGRAVRRVPPCRQGEVLLDLGVVVAAPAGVPEQRPGRAGGRRLGVREGQ